MFLSVLKWAAILVGLLIAYVIYEGMDEMKQGFAVLYCMGFAGFWYALKEIREVEQRVSKRMDYLHKRLKALEGWPTDDE